MNANDYFRKWFFFTSENDKFFAAQPEKQLNSVKSLQEAKNKNITFSNYLDRSKTFFFLKNVHLSFKNMVFNIPFRSRKEMHYTVSTYPNVTEVC